MGSSVYIPAGGSRSPENRLKLRITTFIVENLFGRYAFLDKPPEEQPKNYPDIIRITDVVVLDPTHKGGVAPTPISQAQRLNMAAAAPGCTAWSAPVDGARSGPGSHWARAGAAGRWPTRWAPGEVSPHGPKPCSALQSP
jgi:hypothetical protein